MLTVIMLNVIMLSVIMLSVVAIATAKDLNIYFIFFLKTLIGSFKLKLRADLGSITVQSIVVWPDV